MFEDILNQKHYSTTEDIILSQSYTIDENCELSANSDIPSICTDSKNIYVNNLHRESTQQINSFVVKKQKQQKEKKKRIRKYISNNPYNKKGHWTEQENLKYHYFLEAHASFFIDSQRRKVDKIFKSMSSFIQTRQAHQCRSHHQKIQKKWGSFPNILLNLRVQNFKQTKGKKVLVQFLKMGYNQIYIFEDQDLQNQEQLYKRVLQSRNCQNKCMIQQHKLEQNNQVIDNLLSHHRPNCLCLMMSEKYEDQLLF